MKRSALAAVALILAAFLIVGCNQLPQETPTVPVPPAPPIEGLEEINLENYLSQEPVKVTKDHQLLESLWAEYIYPGVLNIANGGAEYKSVSEIDPLNIARYLNYQMQREGVLEETNFSKDAYLSYGVPISKLEEFSERYFNVRINFRDYPNKNELYVDETNGICYFYPNGTYDDLVKVPYNDIASWPNFKLDNVAIYSDGIYIATCHLQTYQGIDGELLEYKLVLKQREDESFYFVMADGRYPKTNKITVSGRYSPLDDVLKERISDIVYVMEDLNQAVVLDQVAATFREYKTIDLTDGKTLSAFRVENSIQKPIKYAQMIGEKLVVISDRKIHISDCRSREESIIDIPDKLMDSIKPINEYDDYGAITLSTGLDQLALVDGEGIKLYNFNSEELTLIPDTSPKHDEDNIVENEGYGELRFVAGDSKLWATKFGYEWRVGYLFYTIEGGQSKFLPYGGGYDARDLFYGDAALLLNHVIDKQVMENEAMIVDFATGEAVKTEVEDSQLLGTVIPSQNGQTVVFHQEMASQGMLVNKLYTLSILDNKAVKLQEFDLQVSAPSVANITNYCTKNGRIYLKITYLDEQVGIMVG